MTVSLLALSGCFGGTVNLTERMLVTNIHETLTPEDRPIGVTMFATFRNKAFKFGRGGIGPLHPVSLACAAGLEHCGGTVVRGFDLTASDWLLLASADVGRGRNPDPHRRQLSAPSPLPPAPSFLRDDPVERQRVLRDTARQARQTAHRQRVGLACLCLGFLLRGIAILLCQMRRGSIQGAVGGGGATPGDAFGVCQRGVAARCQCSRMCIRSQLVT